jgi:hypothetical protein
MARARMKLPHGAGTQPPWRVSTNADQIVVWLTSHSTRPKRIGAVSRQLAADASRYGQDLVGNLVETALQEAERRKTLSQS